MVPRKLWGEKNWIETDCNLLAAKGQHLRSLHSSFPPSVGELLKGSSGILHRYPGYLRAVSAMNIHEYPLEASHFGQTVKPIDFSMFSHVFPLTLVMFSSFQASPKMSENNWKYVGYLQITGSYWTIPSFSLYFDSHHWISAPKKSPPDANHAVGCASCWSTKPFWACRTKRGVAPKPPWLKFRKPGLSTD